MNKPLSAVPLQAKPTMKRPLELMPASLLPYRQTWQPLVHSLPNNTCLIVTNLERPINVSMLRMADVLRRQGQVVYVLSVG